MKNFSFAFLSLLIISTFLFSSCSKDGRNAETTIKLKVIDDITNKPADNLTVYAVSAFMWNNLGADSYRSAEEQVVTDVFGEASFIVSDFSGAFSGKTKQETFYFLVRYRRGNTSYNVSRGYTFQKGDNKVEIIHLN